MAEKDRLTQNAFSVDRSLARPKRKRKIVFTASCAWLMAALLPATQTLKASERWVWAARRSHRQAKGAGAAGVSAPVCPTTLQAKVCANRTFPFLDAIDTARPAIAIAGGCRCQCQPHTIWSMHDDVELILPGARRGHGAKQDNDAFRTTPGARHADRLGRRRVCPASAGPCHPHGARQTRLPPSTGMHVDQSALINTGRPTEN